MIVVWEAVLFTDWAPPTTGTLARISHASTAQFWDRERLLSQSIHETARTGGTPLLSRVCEGGDVVWDVAAIYPGDTTWQDAIPEPLFFDGPIVNVMDSFRHELSKVLSH